MSDSEKELFGGSSDIEDASDHVDQEEMREPIRKSVNLKRYAPSHVSESAFVSRVPAFLSLEPQPFDAEKYAGMGKTDDDFATEANTIRWTYAANDSAEDGGEKVARVSNARVVTWSDGSQTLQLGGEHFEIKTHAQSEPVFICARQDGEDQLLETRQLVDQTMSFLPTSTASATHSMLARSLARKHLNSQIRVGSVNTTEDPDRVQREIERTEQAKEKARKKLSSQREDIISLAGRTPFAAAGAAAGMSEDEDGDANMNENASEDEYEDDEADETHASRLNRIKQRADDDDDDEDDEDDDKADDDGETTGAVPQRRKVLDDSD